MHVEGRDLVAKERSSAATVAALHDAADEELERSRPLAGLWLPGVAMLGVAIFLVVTLPTIGFVSRLWFAIPAAFGALGGFTTGVSLASRLQRSSLHRLLAVSLGNRE